MGNLGFFSPLIRWSLLRDYSGYSSLKLHNFFATLVLSNSKKCKCHLWWFIVYPPYQIPSPSLLRGTGEPWLAVDFSAE